MDPEEEGEGGVVVTRHAALPDVRPVGSDDAMEPGLITNTKALCALRSVIASRDAADAISVSSIRGSVCLNRVGSATQESRVFVLFTPLSIFRSLYVPATNTGPAAPDPWTQSPAGPGEPRDPRSLIKKQKEKPNSDFVFRSSLAEENFISLLFLLRETFAAPQL